MRFILSLLLVISLSSVLTAADYAVLVGVEKYGKSTGLNHLQFPEDDVEALATLLIGNGYKTNNVSVLTQARSLDDPELSPTLRNIERELDLILSGLSASDSVVLAFAGHGVKFKDADPSYFCPVDCGLSKRTNLLSYASLYKRLLRCQAGRKLLLSDACRNDPLSASARSAPSLTRPEPELPPGSTVALFACKAGQEAREDPKLKHGVFFHYVLEGLRGKADQPGDDSTGNGNSTVELTELAAFTQNKVRSHVRVAFRTKQEPELKTHVDNIQHLLRYPVLRLDAIPLVITNSIGMKLRLIKAGEFQMGATRSSAALASVFETKAAYFDDELPQHRVRISQDFRLGVTEVTQGQWRAVMGTTPWSGKSSVKEGADYAASYVSWDDAVEFCRKLSVRDGTTYRLPTEAEWEYACRAGSTSMYGFGDSLGSLKDYAWFDENADDIYERYAHLVSRKRANAWGLYDMHGNVFEWCSDWYGEDYYKASPVADPRGPSTGSFRVNRGGSWFFTPQGVRSANRGRDSPGRRSSSLGFRVLRSSIR